MHPVEFNAVELMSCGCFAFLIPDLMKCSLVLFVALFCYVLPHFFSTHHYDLHSNTVGVHAINMHLRVSRGPPGAERAILEDGLSRSGGADHQEQQSGDER